LLVLLALAALGATLPALCTSDDCHALALKLTLLHNRPTIYPTNSVYTLLYILIALVVGFALGRRWYSPHAFQNSGEARLAHAVSEHFGPARCARSA
jgi:hypothetical protein